MVARAQRRCAIAQALVAERAVRTARDCSAAARAVAFPKAPDQLAEDTREAHAGL